MKKLAVIFPGVGYHADKPLLYYASKIARSFEYEVKVLSYSDLPQGIKCDAKKMRQAFDIAMEQAEKQLNEVVFSEYEKVLFISKSVGTVVASAYAKRNQMNPDQLFFTPVEATFQFGKQRGIVFHGDADSWVKTALVEDVCKEQEMKLYITKGADHSLETGDVVKDIQNLKRTMERVQLYIEEVAKRPERQLSGAEQFLICYTTRAQREQIVRESLGYSDVGCEDCGDGYEMYLPYIEGKKELREITMEYQAHYVRAMDMEERSGCPMM